MLPNDVPANEVPNEFIELVKQALENLYDFPFLQRHPLTTYLNNHASVHDEPIGHQLRHELIAAIETLNPGNSVSVRSSISRLFNLIHLHYIGGMTIQETALELGISLRQAYRDLRRGQESISEILWLKYRSPATPTKVPTSPIHSEVARLESETKLTNITQLLTTALKAVEKLAERQGVTINATLPSTRVEIRTNAVIAQQIFINILSQIIQQAPNTTVNLSLLIHETQFSLSVIFDADVSFHPVLLDLLNEVGWTFEAENHRINIKLLERLATILTVDDNEGLHSLLERMLTGSGFQFVFATNGLDGLKLAQSLLPQTIILDLMMPNMDGWELLQRLKVDPATKDIPVVICSVINDPELAYSLGAAHFLAKPLNKEELHQVMRNLGF